MKLAHSIKNKSGEEIAHSGRKINAQILKEIQKAKITEIEVDITDLEGAWTAGDVVDTTTGEVMLEANSELTADKVSKILDSGVVEMSLFFPERDDVGTVISQTLKRDAIKTPQEALIEIYRKLRPGDPPTLDTATALFHGMFFDPRKYDFSRVGRLKFNIKLFENQEATSLDKRTLDPDDFYATIAYLLKLRKNIGAVDDIDHLGNRRVRAVGELMENQFRIGLVRMERAIKEKMTVYQEMSTAMPHDLVNAKPVMAAIREFFGSSQLSQFMDQTNPLSEITHKRRLSALGPGGLSRERAGFEVRDVHPTHYGRICPIETPEGPNIGLISSLSCYARINDYGFIESPYRKIKGGRVIDYVTIVNVGDSDYKVGDHMEKHEIEKINDELKEKRKKPAQIEPFSFYLSAWEEDRHTIAQANVELDDKGRIVAELVNARKAGNFVLVSREEVDYVDVSPKQLVSVAASLVPFLEHDDANRALMGANMQRQSVPLLRAQAPIVGTGMEGVTARDSGAVVLARRNGIIDSVDSERIIVRVEGEHHPTQLSREVGSDIYQLTKFKRSNQNTCINQKPVVKKGQRVLKGEIIADGPCTDHGELALGRNVLVAFMPWRGYNFEDAILVSEKMVKEDYYTSLHIEEYEIEARDTKLGPGRSHARHSKRQRVHAAQPGRSGRDSHRRQHQAGRHSGGQGYAEGRNPAHAGREAAARDLRRKGRRRARRFPLLPAGHRGRHRRCEDLLAQGPGKGRAREGHRSHADREVGKEPFGRNPNSDRRAVEASRQHPGRQGSAGRPARRAHQQAPADQGQHADARRDRAHLDPQPEAHQVRRQGSAGERADRRDRGNDLAPDRRAQEDRQREERKADQGRRTAAGRDQAGQGLHRHEAQAECR